MYSFRDKMNAVRYHIADYFFAYLIGVIIIAIVGVAVFAFVSHENGIHAGTVTSKVDHPAYTSTICTGKPVMCYPQFHPERWSVTISAGKQTNDFDLPKSQWDGISQGDSIAFKGDTLVTG